MAKKGWFTLSALRRILHMKPDETTQLEPHAIPSFLRPGMGGTTIAHPTRHEILACILNGGEIRVSLDDPKQGIVGQWTVEDPELCEIDAVGALISIPGAPKSIPLTGLTECDPGAYAHTLFQMTSVDAHLKEEGYRCFHSSKWVDPDTGEEKRRRIILVCPKF